jgi:hypothetical protein
MIVYLGMPRCASSWLYNQLCSTNEIKETHYLYSTPMDIDRYCTNRAFDFSTNNWSMDSDVARAIDPYVSKYILIFRNPIELWRSFQSNPITQTSAQSLIINKLLCYGDIVERWYSLVNSDKIIIENYSEIEKDCVMFIKNLTSKLEIPEPQHISSEKINVFDKKSMAISNREQQILIEQVDKLEKITNRKFNWTINNIL